MLNQQYRHIGRQGRHGLQQLFTLPRRYAGHGFVQQQHARLAGQRNGDLQQTSLAVGQHVGGLVHHLGQVKLGQQFFASRNDCFV